MNNLGRPAIGFTAALGLALLLPSVGSATASVTPKSACSGSASFTITLGFDPSTNLPTVNPASNTTCVIGGETITFTPSGLPSGMTWSVTFPAPSAGGSLFTDSCTISGSTQSSGCTVVNSPQSGDYNYSVTETLNNTNYTLDPKVIVSGVGTTPHKRHKKPAQSPETAAPPPQQ